MSKDADKTVVPPFELDFGDGTKLTLVPAFEGDFLSMFKDAPEGTTEEAARYSYAYNLFQAIAHLVTMPEVDSAEGSDPETA